MARVIVCGSSGDDAELLKLLEEAGCEIVDEAKSPSDVSDSNESPDALIVILKPGLEEDSDLEGKTIHTVNRGCPVIAIWPLGAKSEVVPACIKKFGTSQIEWDASKLRAAVCGEEEPVFETSTGEPRPAPDTSRNVCR